MKRHIFFLITVLFLLESCKKLIEVKPPTNQLVSSNVYTTSTSANAVLLGLYVELASNNGGFLAYYNLYSGLQADEMDNYDPSVLTNQQFYTNSLASTNVSFWIELYNEVYTANTAIANLNASAIDSTVKRQLLGEAYFMRGFLYFYIGNMWGTSPLITSANYTITQNASNSTPGAIVQQELSDLQQAATLLNSSFVGSDAITASSERIRPTSWAAHALLARVYQFSGNWAAAAKEADTVLGNAGLFNLDSLNNVFLNNSTEAIWQLQPDNPGFNSFDAFNLILTSVPAAGGQPFALSSWLYNTFEAGDERRTQWIDSLVDPSGTYYYAYKYKVNYGASNISEYNMVLRLAEQYLIRAEAEANGAGNGINAAIIDVNTIRARAGLSTYSGPTDKTSVLNEIYHQRQDELFLEWGFRWLDLKRLGLASPLLSVEKNISVTTNDTLYPVPLYDIQIDQNLKQNPGYN